MMIDALIDLKDLRLLQPESILLETEQVVQARKFSQGEKDEAQQWQDYLNALALVGFEEWIGERKPKSTIHRNFNSVRDIYFLTVDGFNICLLAATEHLLDEVVSIPQDVVNVPELTAHFYVILEVSEEQEYVIIRGFLRYEQLVNYLHRSNFHSLADGCYPVPFSEFDAETNHLLFYTHYLEPSAIPLSGVVANATEERLLEHLTETRVKLSQWLQGIFEEGWQTIDLLLSPEANLALGTRNLNLSEGIKGGKLINLGMQLGSQAVALLLTVTPEAEGKVGVQVQLHPTGEERYLPSNLKLKLLSKAGKNLQKVQSRGQDNYIQLNFFRGEPGKRFSVEVGLGDIRVRENFEF